MTKDNKTESISMFGDRIDNTHQLVPLHMDLLIVVDGKINGLKVCLLKDMIVHLQISRIKRF